MIRCAVVCPHPPLLFRELAGRRDAAQDLRSACASAVAESLAPAPDVVVVIGGHRATQLWHDGLAPRPQGFGSRSTDGGDGLPLSLGVGRRLLDEAGWAGPVQLRTVAWDATVGDVQAQGKEIAAAPGEAVLLVLGDGSARRGEQAPGYLDDRAFDFDERTARALATGDPEGLLSQDTDLAAALMARGRAVFQVLAATAQAQGQRPRARLGYRDDPFGVSYFVATWRMAP